MSSTTVLDSHSRRGFLQHLLGLYFSPAKEFTAIIPKARYWMPLVLLVALQVAFTAAWLSNMDMAEFLKAEAERAGTLERIPAEGREQAFESQAGFMRPVFMAFALFASPIVVFALGGIYLFLLRFFLASEVTFKRVLAVVAWSFAVVSTVTTPLILITLYLKADWTLNPEQALQANVAMFLDQETAPKALYAFLERFDLFSFWVLFLLYTGFRIATPQKASSVAFAVLTPWVVYVIGKVALATLL